MESPAGEPQPIPRDVLKITNGFNNLLENKSPRYRTEGVDSSGQRITNIDIIEKFVSDGRDIAMGIRLEAGFIYASDGTLKENSYATVVDEDANFRIGLPLDPDGKINVQKISEWDIMTRQKVRVIMDRLQTIAFSATEE